MTVSYRRDIIGYGGLYKSLFRWRGSLYKMVYKDHFVFILFYAALSCTYHYGLSEPRKRTFEKIAVYCNNNASKIILTFILGWYVSQVLGRFWMQWNLTPHPNRMSMYVAAYIVGNDERARIIRRTIMRYLGAGFVMTLRSMSATTMKRFPTLTHVTEAGFLLHNEQSVIEKLETKNNKYFVPFVWATSLVSVARKEGKIKEDLSVQKLVNEINDFRGGCGALLSFDWVTTPLVYTQVLTIAVYTWILVNLLGKYKFEDPSQNVGDSTFPFFTCIQFVIYVGWLKVAEQGANPWGEDDDDFDVNILIDKFLHESYIVVDEMFENLPDLMKDQYWDNVDFILPHTEASYKGAKDEFLGSVAGLVLSEKQQQVVDIADMIVEEPHSVPPTPSTIQEIRRKSISGPRSSARMRRMSQFQKVEKEEGDDEDEPEGDGANAAKSK